ncbi:MAG: hypothetical protein ACTSVA_02115 [Candidatus Njordarchaeales archaeon]
MPRALLAELISYFLPISYMKIRYRISPMIAITEAIKATIDRPIIDRNNSIEIRSPRARVLAIAKINATLAGKSKSIIKTLRRYNPR